MNALPEVEADLHMALSDLRLQHGQSEAALEELRKAQRRSTFLMDWHFD